MNYAHIVQELEEVARQLNLEIRHEKGDFEGGYCILKDKKVMVINKRLLESRKAVAMALALAEYGIDSVFIKPNIRSFIEDEVAKMRRAK